MRAGFFFQISGQGHSRRQLCLSRLKTGVEVVAGLLIDGFRYISPVERRIYGAAGQNQDKEER
jgi:hypothetical protein